MFKQEASYASIFGTVGMIVCSCNVIMEREIKSVIRELLSSDPWQLIVPLQVYHEMGKRGKCCGCFPRLVDIIVNTTEAFHSEMQSEQEKVVQFIARLKEKHQQCETARMLAQHRLRQVRVA